MPTGYHHLAYRERCQIYVLLDRGLSQREIVVQLGRDPGTISREISRNRGKRSYRHKQAKRDAHAVAGTLQHHGIVVDLDGPGFHG